MREACEKLTKSGLVKNVRYDYQTIEGRPEVAVVLTAEDELPLPSAVIKGKDLDEEAAWEWLRKVDPLFTRQLLRTQFALALSILHPQVPPDHHRDEAVTSEITADKAGNATGIVFQVQKFREMKHAKGKK